MIFFWVFGLISIFILTLFSWAWFLGWNFYYFFFLLYMADKASLFFLEINQSCNLCHKFLFGMLYINLLNLVWFWSRIWRFYKFWSFKSWGFWYLRISRLILILHLKCFLFKFMWFFVFLLKAVGIKSQNNMLGLGFLSGDAELSEEEQVVVRGSQLKSHKWGTNERWSEEKLLLGYDECNSSIYSSN